jgi:transcription initiation factor TFIIIB Brf1 subunit/transcription initiation factor TFIIB
VDDSRIEPLTVEKSSQERLFRELGANEAVRSRSMELLSSYLKEKPEDRARMDILNASALYMSFILEDRPVSQDLVAGAAGISSSTLRKWYKRMAAVVKPM